MVDIKLRKRRPIPERPVIIQSGDLCLEGLFINKKSEYFPALFNSPHPQFGGNMDSSLLNELAYYLASEGISSLRYNYRGVGASQGKSMGTEEESEDMLSALDFLLESTSGGLKDPLVVAGYSYGAWIAYLVALQDRRLRRILLVAPPFEKFDFSKLPQIKTSLAILVGENDSHCPVEKLRSFLMSLKKKNHHWEVPQVYVVEEATHYFVRGLVEAGRVGAAFLRTGKFKLDEEKKNQ